MRILFVCNSNTCRSPIAEALFRSKVEGMEVEIRSAGVAAVDGEPASLHATQVMMQRGINHTHKAKRLDEELISWADIVLTMTGEHKRMVVEAFPETSDKVYVLKEYVGYGDNPDITDPLGGDLTTYQHCAWEIEQALVLLSEKLADRQG